MRRHSTIFVSVGVLVVAIALGLTASRKSLPEIEHDAYIWQRSWKTSLLESISGNKDLVRAWRVLAAHAGPAGNLIPVSIHAKALVESGRALVMVVRIDGQLPNLDQSHIIDEVLALRERWRAQGLTVAGLEIDHDCGTAKLPGYAKFLTQLRTRLDRSTQLSITALPAWLSSNHLADVLGAIDESVLQVHSVSHPGSGLFDPEQAKKWIAEYAKKSPTTFRVALPTYGSRVGFDDFGSVAFVESEAAAGRGGANSHELVVTPESVRQLMIAVGGQRPANFRGYAWFRLPTEADKRAWSISTWRGLIVGKPQTQAARITAKPNKDPRLFDLVAENHSETDVLQPLGVKLASHCSDADGVNGYEPRQIDGIFWLVRKAPSLLRPKHEINLGWARCEQNPELLVHEKS
jgi:hypothetical protein